MCITTASRTRGRPSARLGPWECVSRPDAYTPGVRWALVGRLAIVALIAATVMLVAVPVIAGFWSRDAVDLAMSRRNATVSTIRCLDLRQPGNMDKVRRLPQLDLARYVVACNLTYTKDCSGSSTTPLDPKTGQPIGPTRSSAYTCEIRDKHGKVVQTYTTDALRPTP